MLSTRPIALSTDVDTVQPILTTKTPGRAKGLKNRAALQENAIHSGAKTVLSKKSVLQTPFRPGTAHGKKPLVSVSVTRPLMDKTPAPNRVGPSMGFGASKTPATKGFKLSKLSLLVPEPEEPEPLSPDVAPLLRPSSTRKSLRGRLSGTFKTPMTKGDYWNVSPGDMDMELAAGTSEQTKEETMPVEDEEDEIEYMPPTAIELPYEPPFELPDYRNLGRDLFNFGHATLVDDTLDAYYAADIEKQLDVATIASACGPDNSSSLIDGLDLPDLEDDSPFPRKALKPTPSALAKAVGPSSRGVPVRSAQSSAAQTGIGPRAGVIPAGRASSRTVSSGSAPAPGPAPTRTSVLRAAKAAAASNSATTPNPTQLVARAGARPASAIPIRKAVSSTASKPPTRPGAPAAPKAPAPATRPRSATAVIGTGTAGRARSATVVASSSRTKVSNSAAPAKPKSPGDSLAEQLERDVGGGLDDDFQFEL
ncbi:hypothetical protein C8Q79DRAFT_1010884 [Trametes meyenii]|nr:hypothetical protein C8Q79DRAFT_1010884 [Trametes meyenii]